MDCIIEINHQLIPWDGSPAEETLNDLVNTIPVEIKNFANDIKNFNFLDFIENDKINQDKLDVALYVLKCHYQWYKIKADVYKHIITRSTLIALNKRHDIYKCISRRVLENCLDIICHNINIIEANNILRRVLLSYNNIHITIIHSNIPS